MKTRMKGFTLIELIAVLVIMAIIALIVTPLVMSIIRKARISADKRSIDAYGRSIELAIAGYLLDTGKFPTEVSQLTIEYSGNKVVCSTTQINTDSSVYLAGCTVAGRSVDNYTYGEDKTPQAPTYAAYQVGDQVSYNSINYYVIKDSDTTEESVTLLKAEPLSVREIATYSVGTGAETDDNGGMEYGETSTYSTSYVKSTVDAWASENASAATEVRLIALNDLVDNLGYEQDQSVATMMRPNQSNTPSWVYNDQYYYYTMTPAEDSTIVKVYSVGKFGGTLIYSGNPYSGTGGFGSVRPVIEINKSAEITKLAA